MDVAEPATHPNNQKLHKAIILTQNEDLTYGIILDLTSGTIHSGYGDGTAVKCEVSLEASDMHLKAFNAAEIERFLDLAEV